MLGSLVTVEQPVSGLLVSFFPDGSRRERRVAAVMQTRRLDDIRPEYSGLYLIKEQVRIQGQEEQGEQAGVASGGKYAKS